MADMTNLKQLEYVPEERAHRYRIKFEFTDRTTGEPGQLFRHFVGSLEHAQAERDHLKFHLRAGRDPDLYPREYLGERTAARDGRKRDDEHTFDEMWDAYKRWREGNLKGRRGAVKQTSWNLEQQIMQDHVLPDLGQMIVERVDAGALESMLNRWGAAFLPEEGLEPEDHHYSPATLNGWLRYLKHFLGWVSDEMQVFMPMKRLKPWPEPKDKGRALEPDEIPVLLKKLKELYPDYWALTYVSLFGGGMRWGTVTALKWSDIVRDDEGGYIKIERTQYKGRIRRVRRNTASTKRTPVSIPLKPFDAVLEWHRNHLEATKHPGRGSDWVFPAKIDPDESKYGGILVHPKAYTKALARTCKKAELERITHHDLRRTFNSVALERTDAKETLIRKAIGHVSEGMTERYYRQSAQALERVVEQVAAHAENDAEEAAAAE